MMKPAEWEQVRVARCAELWARLSGLPDQYREWVLHTARDAGNPTFSLAGRLTYPQYVAYDVAVSRCERELRRRGVA